MMATKMGMDRLTDGGKVSRAGGKSVGGGENFVGRTIDGVSRQPITARHDATTEKLIDFRVISAAHCGNSITVN